MILTAWFGGSAEDGQMLRQGANSAVRFSSYSTLKQLAQGSVMAGSQLPGWMTFGIGSMAGVITVCKCLRN